MNNQLEEKFFKDFVKLKRGYDLPNDELKNGIYPVIASTNIKGFHNQYKVEPPIVVTGRSGSLGKVQYINCKGWPLNTSLYVKDFKGNHPKYVYYFLQTLHLETFNSGAGVPTLNQNHLHKLKIRPHKKNLQSKVADILSAYDDLIENNQKRIAILENMAEQLYKEWFVRMRFPGFQTTKFIKGVPEGWELTKFSKFITLKRGYDLPDSNIEEGPYPIVASTNIKGYHKYYKVNPPCICTGRSGSLGTVQYIDKKCWPLNTSLYVKDFKNNSPRFVYYLLKGLHLETFNSGAGVPTLNRNHLNGLKINLPPVSLQVKFEEKVNPIFSQVDNLKNQNENLRQTRDLLLPRLISGKLSVQKAEKQMEAIA